MNHGIEIAEETWQTGRRQFQDGLWSEAEKSFVKALESVDDGDSVIDKQYLPLLLDLAELLVLKERKQDCKSLLQNTISTIEDHYPEETRVLLAAYLAYIDSLSMPDEFLEAEDYIARAIDIADCPNHRKDGKYIQALTARAASHLAQENFEEANPLIDRCLALCTKYGIYEGDSRCGALLFKGLLLHLSGDLEGSEIVFLQGIEAVKNDRYSRSFQDVCFGYTTLLISQSRFTDAIAFLNKEIDAREKKTTRDHPLLKRAIASLAIVNSAYGDLAEAEVQAQRYLRLVELMGDAGVELRIDCLRTLIDILVEQSRYPDAEVLLNRANDILEKLPDEYIKATLLTDVARLKVELGLYDEAESLCKKALTITEEIKGEDHIETAMCLSILGSAYFSNRKTAEAEATYRKAIDLIEKHHRFFTSFVGAENYRNLGIILTRQKKFEEAEEMFLKILAHHERSNGQLQVQMAETHRNLGELFEAQHKHQEAMQQYQLALTIAQSIFGQENYEISEYISLLADVYKKEGRYIEAEDLYKKALKLNETTLGPQHPKTCALLQRFGEMAIERKQFKEAEGYFMAALVRLEQTLGTIHPEVGYSCFCLGATFHWQENLPKAEEFYKRALAIKEKQLGRSHSDLTNILAPLIDILTHQGKAAEAATLKRRVKEISAEGKVNRPG